MVRYAPTAIEVRIARVNDANGPIADRSVRPLRPAAIRSRLL